MAGILLVLAFLIGAVTVVAVEFVILWIMIRRLSRKGDRQDIKDKSTSQTDFPDDLSSSSVVDKQGFIWLLEPEKVSKSAHQDKVTADRRKRKDILEVTPVKKYARVTDHCLILLESDGSSIKFSLSGCTVVAVSSSGYSSRKWAKRFPIKVESNNSAIYRGSKIIYIYLETTWEKETWCKALRLASFEDNEKLIWFSKLTRDFQCYLDLLNTGYPSFVKTSTDFNSESKDTSVKLENASSKIRQFLKKLAKKAPKTGSDNKVGGVFVLEQDERKTKVKSSSIPENVSRKMDAKGKSPNIASVDSCLVSSISIDPETKNLSGLTNVESCDNCSDEGALCLNMLVSRLFFDAKSNIQIMASIQRRIQRVLSNMRVPSYIGEVICTAVNPGTLPPHILAMKALPSDMHEAWSFEVNFEYLGGMVLDIETRLEIQELEHQNENSHLDSNSAREVTSDLLESFEHLGKQLTSSEENIDEAKKDEENFDSGASSTSVDMHDDILRSSEIVETDKGSSACPAPSHGSRWKSIVNSVSKQVSQVPLSLGIKISSLAGTIQLCMKPPPSDQIWYGFTSMPDIQFDVETSVGDRRITSGRVAQFLINRLKVAIREALVIPNFESISISWMLAEKDDWVPRGIAPYVWYRTSQDSVTEMPKHEPLIVKAIMPSAGNPTTDIGHENRGNIPKITSSKSLDQLPVSSNLEVNELTLEEGSSLQELRFPLLNKDTMAAPISTTKMSDTRVNNTSSRAITDGMVQNAEDDDESRQRRIGTRERMRGLSRKMSEKLEVKRRHFEEKGRSLVEKMRGQ